MSFDGQQKSMKKKTMKYTKRLPSQTFMRLDHEPYRNQLRNKMLKSKMKNKGWANDVSIIHKGRGNTKGKTPQRTLQCTKMG
jgi:hypothetical protein